MHLVGCKIIKDPTGQLKPGQTAAMTVSDELMEKLVDACLDAKETSRMTPEEEAEEIKNHQEWLDSLCPACGNETYDDLTDVHCRPGYCETYKMEIK